MKNRFLLLLVIFATNVFSQESEFSDNFTAEVGEEYEETDGGLKEFYKYEDYVIKLVNHKSYNLIIQKFDPVTLTEIKRIEKVDFFKDIKKGRLLSVERLSDKLVLLYRLWDKKAETTSFRIRTIALNSLEISDFKTVLSQKGEVSRRAFYKETSFDQKKLLIAFKIKPEKKKDSKGFDKFSINVFDENINKIWSNNIQMPYENNRTINLDFSIDNEGYFYALTWVFKDEKSKNWMYKKGKRKLPFLNIDKRVELLKFNETTNEFIKNEIKIDDYFIANSWIAKAPKGGVMVVGTLGKSFMNKKKVDLLFPVGFFTSKFTKEIAVNEINSYDFSDSILNKYKEDKRINKKELSKYGDCFSDLAIADLVFNDDGSLILIGEQGRGTLRDVIGASIGYMYTSVSIKLDDIYIAKILADGSLAWSNRLPKQQRVDNRGASEMSFKYVDLNNKHYLFYQDHIANLNRADDEAPSPLWDLTTGYLMAYTIDDVTGGVKKEAIFNLATVNNGKKLEHFITDNVLRLSDSEILIEGFEGSSKDFLIKVTAKK